MKKERETVKQRRFYIRKKKQCEKIREKIRKRASEQYSGKAFVDDRRFRIMTEQEHYSLRWNNHQHHILRAFDALLQTKSLVDVTLVCAETSIRAHKVVLSACSPFFQNVFAENPCKHPVIVLKDFPGWVVQAVVDFMYRGEISVPQKRLETLIQVGESLQIRGLVEHRVAATKDLSLDESAVDYLEPPQLSNDSIEPNNYGDDDDDDDDVTPTMVKSTSHSTNAQNGTKHPRLLNSNSFNDISAASIANTTITQTNTTLPINNNNNSSSNSNSSINSNSISNINNHQIHHQHHQQTSLANENRDTACTSPMPRRKQARPRRRSGEGGPHDYSSKSASPLPLIAPDDDDDNNPTETEINKECIESDSHSHINNITTNTITAATATNCSSSSNSSSNVNEQRKLVNKCIESMTGTNLDTDKVVDCTVAAIEKSIIRDKLNANDDEMTDNEMDEDDDEG